MRAHHRHVEQVGLPLHQQVVGGRAAVHTQLAQGAGAVAAHGLDQIDGLQRDRIERGARDVGACSAARQAHQRAARVGVPVRCAEPGEGRHQHHAAAVGYRRGQRFDFARALDDAQPVAQPLHQRTADEDAAFQRIGGGTAVAPGDGGEQAVVRLDRRVTGIHQQEAAGAVGLLGHARRETGLAECGGLLVAADASDGNGRAQHVGPCMAAYADAVHHLRQQGGRNVEQRQQLLAPGAAMDVVQHRARGIAGVADVQRAAGQVPHQPAVDGAEGQFAAPCAFPRARHFAQQPGELGGGEIGVHLQSGQRADAPGVTGLAQAVAVGCGAAVLPHYGGRDRAAALALPQHCGLALVGDAEACNCRGRDTGFGDGGAGAVELRREDLVRVMFDPARLRVVLAEFALRHAAQLAACVEDHRARAGRALIECQQVAHRVFPRPCEQQAYQQPARRSGRRSDKRSASDAVPQPIRRRQMRACCAYLTYGATMPRCGSRRLRDRAL